MAEESKPEQDKKERASETSQTLGRGLDVLELVCASPEGLSPAQLAAELGLARTIVYRLVGTLIEHRLIRRNADGQLTAGLGTLALTENIAPTLRRGAYDVLESLARDVGATAHLCIADGEEAVAIAVVEPQATTFHVSYRPGSRTPIHLGALGKALLAARDGTHGTFTSEGELIAGAKGVVASLPGPRGMACAVGVVTLAATDTDSWPTRVERAAADLSERLFE